MDPSPFSISVIVPVYNSEKILRSCLGSIFLNIYKPLEVIVVDDASTDNSCKTAEEFPCKIIRLSENRGPAYARQVGLRYAKGDIIAYTDSDCIVPSDWLIKITDKLTNNIAGVGGKYILPQHINPISRLFITYWDIKNILFKTPRKSISLYGGNCAFWKDILLKPRRKQELFCCNKKVGGDDTLLCYELQAFGPIIYDPDIYVTHNKNISFIKVLKETITLGYSGSMVAAKCGTQLLKEPQRAYKTFLNIFSITLTAITVFLPFSLFLKQIYISVLGLYIFSTLPLLYFIYKQDKLVPPAARTTSSIGIFKFLYYKTNPVVFLIPIVTWVADIFHFLGLCIKVKDSITKWIRASYRNFRFVLNILNHKSLSRIILFVTKKCNASCEFCFNKDQTVTTENEFSLAEIIKITKHMRYLPWLTISGGEPFLRKDLSCICTAFYNNCKTSKITIVTNGSLPETTEETVEKILLDSPGIYLSVAVAFDHIGENHDTIKGLPGCFKKAEETIKKLSHIKYRFPKRISIGINTILNNENSGKITEITDYLCNNMSYDYHVFNPLRIAPKAPPDAGVISNEKYDKLLKTTNKKLSKRTKFSLKSRLEQAFLEECCDRTLNVHNESYRPCKSINKFLVINNDGNIFPCELLQNSLGNVRENNYKIKTIRKSKYAKNMQKDINRTKCYCQWPCAITSNTFFSFRSHLRIVKNTLRSHFIRQSKNKFTAFA
jgi:glycosyltransferase involved in cell wall biosynthesis/MoaA/NifB/PqqE/SkfB family radical SAM enzyme